MNQEEENFDLSYVYQSTFRTSYVFTVPANKRKRQLLCREKKKKKWNFFEKNKDCVAIRTYAIFASTETHSTRRYSQRVELFYIKTFFIPRIKNIELARITANTANRKTASIRTILSQYTNSKMVLTFAMCILSAVHYNVLGEWTHFST
jgi:hypothetical protein